MRTYLAQLEASTIPFPNWAVIIIWLVVFVVANMLMRRSRALSRAQNVIATETEPGLIKPESLKLTLARLILTAAIFACASLLGGPVFVFLAGGWVVLAAVSCSLNLRRVLYLRAFSGLGAATGSITLSARFAVKDAAFQLLAAATLCLVLGILLAHLALLGGALFLASTGAGYLRKTKRKCASQPSA